MDVHMDYRWGQKHWRSLFKRAGGVQEIHIKSDLKNMENLVAGLQSSRLATNGMLEDDNTLPCPQLRRLLLTERQQLPNRYYGPDDELQPSTAGGQEEGEGGDGVGLEAITPDGIGDNDDADPPEDSEEGSDVDTESVASYDAGVLGEHEEGSIAPDEHSGVTEATPGGHSSMLQSNQYADDPRLVERRRVLGKEIDAILEQREQTGLLSEYRYWTLRQHEDGNFVLVETKL
ncbi:hypothetical protein FA95DRAFT_1575065 [Auriscalpium vulgare]|uniref:Uncharacterized protein n=1 Tax=Auriscalpium vulgare TaxID=40419 RepID=A0ACB8RHW0_9AGAM|nr:hypothetical protein FA95DRAFT_1575065 [Auriscalpium vulgare]